MLVMAAAANFALVVAACCDQEPNTAGTVASDRPELTVSIHPAQYYAIDVLPVRVCLKSPAARSWMLTARLEIGSGLSLWMAGPEDPDYRRAQSFRRSHYMHPFRQEMQPGGVIETSQFVSPSFNGLKFSRPAAGEWKVRAVFKDADGAVTSNVVTIELKKPDALPDETVRFFGAERWHKLALNDGATAKEDDSTAFSQFLSTCKSAPQLNLLAFMVGRNYHMGTTVEYVGEIRDPTTGRYLGPGRAIKQVPNYPLAIATYTQALDLEPPHLRAQILLYLTECYVATGDLGAASRSIQQVPMSDCDTSDRKKLEGLRQAITELDERRQYGS